MINTDVAKWDFSRQEKYAIDWFNAHGFDGTIKKTICKQARLFYYERWSN